MSGVDIGRYKRIVQDFLDPEPANEDGTNTSIWCLGTEYPSKCTPDDLYRFGSNHSKDERVASDRVNGLEEAAGQENPTSELVRSSDASPAEKHPVSQAWPTEFQVDAASRIWLTYRSNFPPIAKSADASMTLSVRLRSLMDTQGFTSDTGWGCMIRSGQCLLANALVLMVLGRNWRRGQAPLEEKRILSLFSDDPFAPFSIHRFVDYGAHACGKHPGEWFGPSATARCIQALAESHKASGLKVYVNPDGPDVYQDRIFQISAANNNDFQPILILLGVRLGIDRVTPAYWSTLKGLLEIPQSVGIAGGRPSSSHYFFAHQGDQFFYLDPHFTRPALPLRHDTAKYTEEEVDSCHTQRLRRLGISDMDPSMLLAFLINDAADWRKWRASIDNLSGKTIIHVADFEPKFPSQDEEREGALDEVETIDGDELDHNETYP